MAYDGSLKFDTKIVDSGFSEGITKLSSMAKKGMTAVTGAMAGMSAYAIKVGADFEAGMSEVAAISGASAQDMEMLTDKAKEMGIQTKFSATEASEAMKYMAMAGWKAADMADGISGIMNLAAASGEELGAVSDIVTDALTAFGLQAKDSGHFADVLAKAASNSNTNVGMMGETFKYAAPLAGTLGYSVEDTAVAIGLMANAGIKGSQAGTAMRGMLTRLIKPTDEVQGAMDALGITISNADGTIKPFNQLMKEMRKAFSKLTDEEKAQRAASLAGQEAMSGFLAIINASDSDFDKLSSAIANADGTAQEMADTMNDNLKGKITLLGSSLEGAGIAAYEKFERPLKKAVEGAIENVNNLSREMSSGSLSESMDKVAQGFASIVDAGVNLATGAIPVIIDGFAFLVDHGNEVVAVLSALATAMITQKTIVPMVNAFGAAAAAIDAYNVKLLACSLSGVQFSGSLTMGQAVVGLFTGKVTLATAATTAWNAACSALGGPIGVIITAVGALAIGIGGLALAMSNEADEHKRIQAEIEEEKNARQELIDQQKEQIETNLGELNNIQGLNDELKHLVDANGKVKKGYEARVGFIINELNNALGLEMTLTDGVIKGNEELDTSIDYLIAKKKAEAILEAQLPAYKEAVTKATEAQIKANEMSMEVTEASMKQKALEAELEAQYGKQWQDLALKANDQRMGTWALLQQDTKEKQQEYDAQNEIVKGYYNDIANYETNAARVASGKAEEIAKVETSIVTTKANTTAESIQLLQKQRRAEVEQLDYLKELYKGTTDEIELQQIKSQEQVIANIDKQINEMTSTVVDGRSEYALAYDGNNKAAVKTILNGKTDVHNASKSLTEEGVKGAEEGSKGFEDVGENSINGILKGFLSKENLARIGEAARNVMKTAVKDSKDEVEIKSPSHVFRDEVGYMAGAGFALGFDKSNGLVKKSVTAMSQAAIDQAKRMQPLMKKNMTLDFSGSFATMRSVAEHQMSDLSPSFSSNIYHTYNADKEVIDYNKIGKATAEAIAQEGIAVKFNNREFGRISKEWI